MKPQVVKRNGVEARIYANESGPVPVWSVRWYEGDALKQRKFSRKGQAQDFAVELAEGLSRGEMAPLGRHERAAYQRAILLLGETPIELAAAEYAAARRKLGGVSLEAAVGYYLSQHAGLSPRPVDEIVKELLAVKQAGGASERWLQDLKSRLGAFSRAFSGPLHLVMGPALAAWLDSLDLAPKSRSNYRGVLGVLFNFAKARHYLPRDHDALSAVERTTAPPEEIQIYTPAEFQSLAKHVPEGMRAYYAIAAFAGLRQAEIQRLDWSEVSERFIEVKARKSKTAARRLIPVAPNLSALLKPLREESGPVCRYAFPANRLGIVAKNAGVEPKHNALRHSFISYRMAQTQNAAQVAMEAGNSERMIYRHYRELVTPEQASEWFSYAFFCGIGKSRSAKK